MVEMGADGRMYAGHLSYDPLSDTWREENQEHPLDGFIDVAAGTDGRLYHAMDEGPGEEGIGVGLQAWEPRSGDFTFVEGPDEPREPDLVLGRDDLLYAFESVGGGSSAAVVYKLDPRAGN
jgi:hypothetical protein